MPSFRELVTALSGVCQKLPKGFRPKGCSDEQILDIESHPGFRILSTSTFDYDSLKPGQLGEIYHFLVCVFAAEEHVGFVNLRNQLNSSINDRNTFTSLLSTRRLGPEQGTHELDWLHGLWEPEEFTGQKAVITEKVSEYEAKNFLGKTSKPDLQLSESDIKNKANSLESEKRFPNVTLKLLNGEDSKPKLFEDMARVILASTKLKKELKVINTAIAALPPNTTLSNPLSDQEFNKLSDGQKYYYWLASANSILEQMQAALEKTSERVSLSSQSEKKKLLDKLIEQLKPVKKSLDDLAHKLEERFVSEDNVRFCDLHSCVERQVELRLKSIEQWINEDEQKKREAISKFSRDVDSFVGGLPSLQLARSPQEFTTDDPPQTGYQAFDSKLFKVNIPDVALDGLRDDMREDHVKQVKRLLTARLEVLNREFFLRELSEEELNFAKSLYERCKKDLNANFHIKSPDKDSWRLRLTINSSLDTIRDCIRRQTKLAVQKEQLVQKIKKVQEYLNQLKIPDEGSTTEELKGFKQALVEKEASLRKYKVKLAKYSDADKIVGKPLKLVTQKLAEVEKLIKHRNAVDRLMLELSTKKYDENLQKAFGEAMKHIDESGLSKMGHGMNLLIAISKYIIEQLKTMENFIAFCITSMKNIDATVSDQNDGNPLNTKESPESSSRNQDSQPVDNKRENSSSGTLGLIKDDLALCQQRAEAHLEKARDLLLPILTEINYVRSNKSTKVTKVYVDGVLSWAVAAATKLHKGEEILNQQTQKKVKTEVGRNILKSLFSWLSSFIRESKKPEPKQPEPKQSTTAKPKQILPEGWEHFTTFGNAQGATCRADVDQSEESHLSCVKRRIQVSAS